MANKSFATCACNKNTYVTQEFAAKVALRRATSSGVVLRPYQCFHGGWHLTSSVSGVTHGAEVSGDAPTTPMERARQLIDHDIRGCLSVEDRRWLFERPLLWLRALRMMENRIQGQTSRDRKRLSPLKPMAGHSPSREYLEAKFGFDERTAKREYIIGQVRERIEDVKSMLPTEVEMVPADLVLMFVEIADLIRVKDYAEAGRLARLHATHISKGKRP